MYAYQQALGFLKFTHSFVKYRLKIKPLEILQNRKRPFTSVQFPIDNISNLKKDVLLYTYNEKSRFFKYLSVFGVAQLGVWVFYGGFMFVSLRDVAALNIKNEEVFTKSSLWQRINLGEKKYRYMSVVLCFGIGLLTAIVCCMLPSRIIKELTLCKGGQAANIVTYGPFGRTSEQKVLLKNLTSVSSRSQAKAYVSVKIKPKWFYYLVDCKGKFHQPKLFDYTVGMKTGKPY